MARTYSQEEINNINLGRKSVLGTLYVDTKGNTFEGVEENKLMLLRTARQTTYKPSATNSATNVQDAIDNIVGGTDLSAQNAVGSILTDTATINFTYDSLNHLITADLKNTTVTAGVYGSATQSPTITIDAQGRITSASNTAIAIAPGVIALPQNQVLVGSAANIAAAVAMSGEASIVSAGTVTLLNSAVIGKVLTGYISGAGVIAATDSILQAIQKLNANDATNANLTGMVTSIGNATTVVTNANLTGEVTSVGNATTVLNSTVIGKVLTGYVSGAGVLAATDTILQAFNKLNGNVSALVTGVSSVTGTLNRITTSPTTGAVVVDIAATYVGQTSLTTLGTITTGTWNSSVISPVYGGTGVANNVASTLAISGAFATTLTVTGVTGITLPLSGTLYGTLANSITSAQLLSSVTDETGTGVLVFGTTPTFTTSIITPLIYGSTAANGDITIEGTSSATKTTSYVNLQTTGGFVGIGNTAPLSKLGITGNLSVGATYGVIAAPTSGAIIEGNTLIGTSAASSTVSALGQKLEVTTSANFGGGAFSTWSTSASNAPAIDMNRSKSATIGTMTTVADGDYLGYIQTRGSDGTSMVRGSQIKCIVVGTVTTGHMPTDMQFVTSSETVQDNEVMRITGTGRIGIGVTLPTSILHLKAGTATANTAPLQFNSGALETTARAGVVEFLTDAWYGTITTGAARKTFAFTPVQVNQTASRALNTTYTNSLVKSVMIVVTCRCAISLLAGTAYFQGKSDSSSPPATISSGIVGVQSGLAGEDNTYEVTFIVAPGMNYRIDSTAVNGTVTLGTWWETTF